MDSPFESKLHFYDILVNTQNFSLISDQTHTKVIQFFENPSHSEIETTPATF